MTLSNCDQLRIIRADKTHDYWQRGGKVCEVRHNAKTSVVQLSESVRYIFRAQKVHREVRTNGGWVRVRSTANSRWDSALKASESI